MKKTNKPHFQRNAVLYFFTISYDDAWNVLTSCKKVLVLTLSRVHTVISHNNEKKNMCRSDGCVEELNLFQ